VNIVVDGIFVGNGVGSVALASVNVAIPVFSIIVSLSLLIAVGGGAVYSMQMGEGKPKEAQKLFSLSFTLVTVIMIVISIFCYLNMESIARVFGANDETLSYAVDYMRVLFIFSLILAWENYFSVF